MPSQADPVMFFMIGLFIWFGIIIFAIVGYVLNAIFLSQILKVAQHRYPYAAWIPYWSTVALFEIGGIGTPWVWVLIIFGAAVLENILFALAAVLFAVSVIIAVIVSLAAIALNVLIMVWTARAVHAGFGMSSLGGVVLAVLIPIVWVIWMAVRAQRIGKYDHHAALAIGATFPWKLSRNYNPWAPFALANFN